MRTVERTLLRFNLEAQYFTDVVGRIVRTSARTEFLIGGPTRRRKVVGEIYIIVPRKQQLASVNESSNIGHVKRRSSEYSRTKLDTTPMLRERTCAQEE
jgi:hypothetical protein